MCLFLFPHRSVVWFFVFLSTSHRLHWKLKLPFLILLACSLAAPLEGSDQDKKKKKKGAAAERVSSACTLAHIQREADVLRTAPHRTAPSRTHGHGYARSHARAHTRTHIQARSCFPSACTPLIAIKSAVFPPESTAETRFCFVFYLFIPNPSRASSFLTCTRRTPTKETIAENIPI